MRLATWTCCLILVATSISLGQTAGMQSFQGLVKDDSGLPIEGPITLEFRVFDAEIGGNMVAGPFGPGAATAQEGLVSTKFGPVPTSAFDGNERWLEVRLDGSVLPRLEFVTPPATAEQLNRPGSGESAIYVDNIGRVGIGTTAPHHALEIVGPTSETRVGITHQGEIPGSAADLFFQAGLESTGSVKCRIIDGAPNSLKSRMDFSVNPGNDNGATRRVMTITEAGRVGIGTPDPFATLHVELGTNLGSAQFGPSPNHDLTFDGGTDSDVRIANTGAPNGSTRFAHETTDLLTIKNNGQVGIGTAAPSVKLDVTTPNEDDAFNVGLRISRDDPGITPILIGNYMKSANIRQGGMIWAHQSLNLVYNSANGGFAFNVFDNINDANTDTAMPVLSCKSNGATAVRVLEVTGGDVAEKFPTTEAVKPGMVVAIDAENAGRLCLARGAYNRRVAGVVSGAGDLPAGAILGNLPGSENDPPIAMAGRVWCWCDASHAPIQPGDRLTTSTTPGHAMRVTDESRASGSVIGKAMTPLQEGRGLVLVLVQPQ